MQNYLHFLVTKHKNEKSPNNNFPCQGDITNPKNFTDTRYTKHEINSTERVLKQALNTNLHHQPTTFRAYHSSC